MGTRAQSIGFWIGAACATALPWIAAAETLDLPPGAVVLPLGSAKLHRHLSAPNSVAIVQPIGSRSSRSALGVELPPGAIVLYDGPPPPKASNERSNPAAPSADVASAITVSAARHGLDRALVEAVAWQESRFDNDRVSPKGARGVMQLTPETAASLQVNERDPRGNIEGGVAYLASLLQRFSGDLSLALAAYNAGPEAVVRYHGVPPFAETQAYVSAILARLNH